jgi:hypothetical protein
MSNSNLLPLNSVVRFYGDSYGKIISWLNYTVPQYRIELKDGSQLTVNIEDCCLMPDLTAATLPSASYIAYKLGNVYFVVTSGSLCDIVKIQDYDKNKTDYKFDVTTASMLRSFEYNGFIVKEI